MPTQNKFYSEMQTEEGVALQNEICPPTNTEVMAMLKGVSRQLEALREVQASNMELRENQNLKGVGMADSLKELRENQKYILKASRKTLGEQYWGEELSELFRGGLKKILTELALCPIKTINIIVFRPAGHAFWFFFGKWAYLLWGLLMMFVLLMCSLTVYLLVDEHYPQYVAYATDTVTFLWVKAGELLSLILEKLEPYFGDAFNILHGRAMDFGDTIITSAWGLVGSAWDFIIATLTEIFSQATSAVLNPITSSVTSSIETVGSWIWG